MSRIAVVDHDVAVGLQLKALFQGARHSVTVFRSGGRFLDALSRAAPDLAVLELALPALSGWDLLPILRGRPETRQIPLIVLTAGERQPEDVVRAMKLGADDFLSKPFEPDVLLARGLALLRRAAWRGEGGPPPGETLAAGEVSVDLDGRAVLVAGAPVRLTRLEFDLLVYLIRNRNRVLTRGLLMTNVWRSAEAQATRTVDKRIEALRRKLKGFGRRIETVSGVGYFLKA